MVTSEERSAVPFVYEWLAFTVARLNMWHLLLWKLSELCSVSPADKTIKLWKVSERDKRPEGYNLKEEDGRYRDPNTVTTLRVKTY